VITKLPSLRFESLKGFVEGTKDMLLDEAWQLARVEHATLHAWIAATPAAQRNYRRRELEKLVEYYWHLDVLINRCESGHSSTHGYAAMLSEQALKHWEQNEKHGG
jgi:hypothetical protein